jgi:hypothetical protein
MRGCAVAVAPRRAVTAAHVLRNVAPGSVVFQLGPVNFGVVDVDSLPDLDIAILTLDGNVPAAAEIGYARGRTKFQVFSRPNPSDPVLTGTIVATDQPHASADGNEHRVLQLLVDQQLGDYNGYSGAAVYVGTRRTAVGIIIEQVAGRRRDPGGRPPTSNVLLAVPLEDLAERFGTTRAPGSEPTTDAPQPPGRASSAAGGIGSTAGMRHADYTNDQGETDLVGIGSDVDTLAIMVASTHTLPPLSIGLFGPWGSGKSFFMRKIRERVDAFAAASAERPEVTSFYCRRIVHIPFNAWHYTEANLWASLATRVFEGLADYVRSHEPEPDEAYRNLLGQLASSKVLLADAERRRDIAKDSVEAAEQARQAESARGARRTVEELVRDHPELRDAAIRLRDELGLEQATTNIADIRQALADLRGSGARLRRAWQVLRARAWTLVGLGSFFVAVLTVAIMLGVWLLQHDQGLAAALASVVGVVTAVTGAARVVVTRMRDVAAVAERLLAVDEQDERAALTAAEQEVQRAREQVATIEAELARIRSLSLSGVYQFVEERYTSADYRQHLGIVALVQKDFDALSRLLSQSTPGTPDIDRIVLYIDDLDRCRPRQVMEVLQALNLLLAFPLFVVVVGVDSRWLLRSVEQHQQIAVSPDDTEFRSTPQQYLEKVFQIPMWVPPLRGDTLGRLVRGLTGPSGGSTPSQTEAGITEPSNLADQPDAGTHLEDAGHARDHLEAPEAIDLTPRGLTLSEHEIAFVAKLAPLIDTPRSAKRLLNLYRLLKVGVADDVAAGLETGPEHKAVLTLLAAMIAAGGEWRRFADALRTTDLDNWETFIDSLRPRRLTGDLGEEWTSSAEKAVPAAQALAMRHLCQKLDQLSPDLADLDVSTLRPWVARVGRFSFGPT